MERTHFLTMNQSQHLLLETKHHVLSLVWAGYIPFSTTAIDYIKLVSSIYAFTRKSIGQQLPSGKLT
jgi:hypothetical protein